MLSSKGSTGVTTLSNRYSTSLSAKGYETLVSTLSNCKGLLSGIPDIFLILSGIPGFDSPVKISLFSTCSSFPSNFGLGSIGAKFITLLEYAFSKQLMFLASPFSF